jgi:hypothetical protein
VRRCRGISPKGIKILAQGKVKRASANFAAALGAKKEGTSAERIALHQRNPLPRPTQSKDTCIDFGLGNVVRAGRGFCSADVPLTFETQGGGQTRGARPSLPWAAILIPCGEPMPRRSWSSSRTSVLFVQSCVPSGLILFGCGQWPR